MNRSNFLILACAVVCAFWAGSAVFASETPERADGAAIKEKASEIALRPIDRLEAEELRVKLERSRGGANPVFVVDLRNEADFQKSFIPGAVNIPFRKLSFLAEKFFSKSDEIVVYGYPGSDAVGESAVIFLRQKGYANVRVLTGGIGGWKGHLEKAAVKAKPDGSIPKVQVTGLDRIGSKKEGRS